MGHTMSSNTVKFYKVGGYVRDMLLGVKSKDLDFAVEAPSYEVMKDAIKARGCDIKLEKPEFATVRAVDPIHGGVDFVLCRKDGYYSDGRRPDAVMAGTLLDDLSRRDFTVNALALDENNNIIDYFNGQTHLKERVLHTVGDAKTRLNEDSLRILRALRFMITKEFTASYELSLALETPSVIENLRNISMERVREELYRMFKYNTWATFDMLFMHHKIMQALEMYFPQLWLKPTLESQ